MRLLHSGQTGVERGVHRAALAVDIPLGGYYDLEGGDEFGALPDAVRRVLRPCVGGARTPVQANLELATALVIVVPDRHRIFQNPGMAALARSARLKAVPLHFVDPTSELDEVAPRLTSAQPDPRILVTGPRVTRWPAGELAGFKLVLALAARWSR